MAADNDHDPKGGNKCGSRTHSTSNDGLRHPNSASQKQANDEGKDAISDIRNENREENMSADLENEPALDDPHRVEKLTKAGRADFDPDAGSD